MNVFITKKDSYTATTSNNVILPHIRSDIFIVGCCTQQTHVNTIVEDICNQPSFLYDVHITTNETTQCDVKFYKER